MFPKRGKSFPEADGQRTCELDYASVVGDALRLQLGTTHQAIKTVMRWTGADQRTIKNWFAGTNGPSGPHLIALFRHSNEVLEACLILADRGDIATKAKFVVIREKLRELLQLFEFDEQN